MRTLIQYDTVYNYLFTDFNFSFGEFRKYTERLGLQKIDFD